VRFERLHWTAKDDSDVYLHSFARFGMGQAFGACVSRDKGRWRAVIVLRLHCRITPNRLGNEGFTTERAAKTWVRVTAETLGLLVRHELPRVGAVVRPPM